MIHIEIINNEVTRSTIFADIAQNYQNMIITDYEDYSPNNIKYIYDGTAIVLNPDYDDIIAQQEAERISNLEISQEKFWNFMDPITRNDAKIEIEKVSGLENKIYNSLENPTYKRDCLIIEILTGIYNLSDSELDLLFDS